eukprot:1353770-Rhodomonas_salina.3
MARFVVGGVTQVPWCGCGVLAVGATAEEAAGVGGVGTWELEGGEYRLRSVRGARLAQDDASDGHALAGTATAMPTTTTLTRAMLTVPAGLPAECERGSYSLNFLDGCDPGRCNPRPCTPCPGTFAPSAPACDGACGGGAVGDGRVRGCSGGGVRQGKRGGVATPPPEAPRPRRAPHRERDRPDIGGREASDVVGRGARGECFAESEHCTEGGQYTPSGLPPDVPSLGADQWTAEDYVWQYVPACDATTLPCLPTAVSRPTPRPVLGAVDAAAELSCRSRARQRLSHRRSRQPLPPGPFLPSSSLLLTVREQSTWLAAVFGNKKALTVLRGPCQDCPKGCPPRTPRPGPASAAACPSSCTSARLFVAHPRGSLSHIRAALRRTSARLFVAHPRGSSSHVFRARALRDTAEISVAWRGVSTVVMLACAHASRWAGAECPDGFRFIARVPGSSFELVDLGSQGLMWRSQPLPAYLSPALLAALTACMVLPASRVAPQVSSTVPSSCSCCCICRVTRAAPNATRFCGGKGGSNDR